MLAGRHWSDVLPGEREMCGQLGVSRVTLRKALAQLSAQRVIRAGGRGKRHMVCATPAGRKAAASVVKRVRCPSPAAALELVWSTRVIFEEIQAILRAGGMSMDFEYRPALWRGAPGARLQRLTAEGPAACWLLYRASPGMQQWFERSRLPCLLLGPAHRGVSLPGVEVDVAALGKHAAAEIARLGHRHVAFVVFDPAAASALATAEGLGTLVTRDGEAGRVTVVADDLTVVGLRRALRSVMHGSDPPTVLMLSSAGQSLPVLGILRELNLRVPEDVSVIVRDHEPLLNRSVPELTRYTFDGQRLGRMAGRLLSEIAESGSGKVTRRVLLPEFIRGETLAPRRAG